MYDKRLDSILAVAELGSFNKAAQELRYSTPALLKQVNEFENQYNITIFERSNKGVKVTSNGAAFLADAEDIIGRCNQALEDARERQERSENLVRVGVSLFQSGQRILELCQNLYLDHTDLIIQFVPVEDTFESYAHVIEHLGESIDVLGSSRLDIDEERYCNMEIVGNPFLCLAVPLHDELAQYEAVDISALKGRRIHVPKRGNPYTDSARDEILKGADGVEFIEFSHYSISVFNECMMLGDILLSKEIWRDVHPLMKTVDVHWNMTMPYCLYYAKNPRPAALKFVKSLKKLVSD